MEEDHFEIEPLADEFTSLHPDNDDLICSRQLALQGPLHRVSWAGTPTDIEEEQRDLLVRTYLYGDSIAGPPTRQDQIPVTTRLTTSRWRRSPISPRSWERSPG